MKNQSFPYEQFTTTRDRLLYPFIVMRRAVVFPWQKVPLVVEGKEALESVNAAMRQDGLIVLMFQKNNQFSPFGVLAKIVQSWNLAPYVMGLNIESNARVRIVEIARQNTTRAVRIEPVPGEKKNEFGTTKTEALSRRLLEQFKQLLQIQGTVPMMVMSVLQKDHLSPEDVSNIVASALPLKFQEKLNIFETMDVEKQLLILSQKISKELNIVKTEKQIDEEVAKNIDKTQREYILQERLKAIERELGIVEEQREYEDLEKKITDAKLPKNIEMRMRKELSRLKRMPPSSAEIPYIRNYIEWIAELPWSRKKESAIDFKKARAILDADHFGLEKTKDRVLEYLAVQKLTQGKSRGNILCFVGPPGTGKTSVGKSIAKALDRDFTRVSLGGIRDEAEIRGHRRTYVGALPGRIIQGLKNTNSKNPVFMLDEIDKLGADFRGDPSSALLEVLDPEQNNAFSDHYLEVPFDLSEVFFITTANILDPIPPALRDRLEVIEFSGYTDQEKLHIGKNFLLPKMMKNSGLHASHLTLDEEAIVRIITHYTREAGVRNLERKLAQVGRKAAKMLTENKTNALTITKKNLIEFLGPEEYDLTMREAKDEIGVATGLAWTPTGGEIIFTEVAALPGKGKLLLTGQLGTVMQESAQAALSYVRSSHQKLKIPKKIFEELDIHLHVPSGAIPKDGPSAGVTMAVALASRLMNKKVRKEVALTGEITLSGKILKVGGIKEKVLAAQRAGVEHIVLPKENEMHLRDIPESTHHTLRFSFVAHMNEVLSLTLKE